MTFWSYQASFKEKKKANAYCTLDKQVFHQMQDKADSLL